MNTAVQLFNWFRWRHWIAFPAMALSVIAAQGLCWFGSASLENGFCNAMLVLSMMLVFACSITVFTFGNDLDLTSGRSSFPPWLYNLPVGSLQLAILPVLAMVLAMSWCWWPAAAGMAFLNDAPVRKDLSSPMALWILPWLAICTFGNTLQAVAWWPFRAGWQRILTLALLFLGGVTLLIVNTIEGVSSSFAWSSTIIVSIAAFGAAVLSAIRARRFTWRSSGLFELPDRSGGGIVSRVVSYLTPRARRHYFETKRAALANREWKSVGRYPVIFYSLLVLPTMGMVLSFLLLYKPDYPQPMMGGFLVMIPWMMAVGCAAVTALAGTAMAKDRYWKGSYEVPVYISALPVSDDSLFRAKAWNTAKMSAGVVLTGLAAMSVVVWAAWVNPDSTRGMIVPDLQMSGGIITDIEFMAQSRFGVTSIEMLCLAAVLCAAVATFGSPWIGLALGMTGRKTFVIYSSTAMMIVAVASMILFEVQLNGEMFYEVVRFALIAMLAVKVVATVLFVAIAWRRGVLTKDLIVTVVTIAGGGLLVSGAIYLLLKQASFRADLWTLFAVTLVPCGSVLFSRIALDWNRHR